MYQCTHNGRTTIICRECSKKKFDVIRDAKNLSSGTVGTLINNSSYDAIEEAQNDFVAWLGNQPRLFENWHAAWSAFSFEMATAVFYEGADDATTEAAILAGLAEYLWIDSILSLTPTQAYFDLETRVKAA